ncbi:hypothetical protein O181_063257 [Austropuccinia psidii MF-1]|uniref:Uncharacterized protein n=1 Tax=Austropuccinia psidii MF-1 TaxID=1389203 RepID=A0A9Q3I163_9BASI|nr:hypothetical protein [Austropuccinia psidii MF-1]
MAASWEEVGITTQKICLNIMVWLDIMKEMKGWNPNKNFKLLEARAVRIKEKQAPIHAIEKLLHMEEPSPIQVAQDKEEVPSSPHQSRNSRTYKPRET